MPLLKQTVTPASEQIAAARLSIEQALPLGVLTLNLSRAKAYCAIDAGLANEIEFAIDARPAVRL